MISSVCLRTKLSTRPNWVRQVWAAVSPQELCVDDGFDYLLMRMLARQDFVLKAAQWRFEWTKHLWVNKSITLENAFGCVKSPVAQPWCCGVANGLPPITASLNLSLKLPIPKPPTLAWLAFLPLWLWATCNKRASRVDSQVKASW